MRASRNGARALALIMGALLSPGAIATAGRSEPTAVTLKTDGFGTYHGRVISDAPECLIRKVGLYEVRPGRDGLNDFELSNAKGKWSFGAQVALGASLQARVKAKSADGVSCEAGRSQVKSF